VLGVYAAVCARLSPAERGVLRDVIAARLAHDYLSEPLASDGTLADEILQ
jgi:hypothetical protein